MKYFRSINRPELHQSFYEVDGTSKNIQRQINVLSSGQIYCYKRTLQVVLCSIDLIPVASIPKYKFDFLWNLYSAHYVPDRNLPE